MRVGGKSSCYTFPKLQNIQLHPSSPALPPSSAGTRTINSVTPQTVDCGRVGEARVLGVFPCGGAHPLEQLSAFSSERGAPWMWSMWAPAPLLWPWPAVSPGGVLGVPEPLSVHHKAEIMFQPSFKISQPWCGLFKGQQAAYCPFAGSLRMQNLSDALLIVVKHT